MNNKTAATSRFLKGVKTIFNEKVYKIVRTAFNQEGEAAALACVNKYMLEPKTADWFVQVALDGFNGF